MTYMGTLHTNLKYHLSHLQCYAWVSWIKKYGDTFIIFYNGKTWYLDTILIRLYFNFFMMIVVGNHIENIIDERLWLL
jgi:hypothetical protein